MIDILKKITNLKETVQIQLRALRISRWKWIKWIFRHFWLSISRQLQESLLFSNLYRRNHWHHIFCIFIQIILLELHRCYKCYMQRPVATTLIHYMAGDAYSVDAPGLAPWEFHVIPILVLNLFFLIDLLALNICILLLNFILMLSLSAFFI
jgi:hypothetical protein